MQKYANDWLNTYERPFHKKSRAMSLRFLLPKLGLVLLAALATLSIAVQSAYGCKGNNNNNNNNQGQNNKNNNNNTKANGTASIRLIDKTATLTKFTLAGAPSNVGLIIHIHAKNTENTGLCKGPVLFVIQNPANAKEVFKTDSNGKFSLKNQEFNLAPPSVPVPGKPPAPPADLSKFDTWYVNVHDATKPLPIPAGSPPGTKPKFASIACGLINEGSNPTRGTAKLAPEKSLATSPASGPIETPVPSKAFTRDGSDTAFS